MSSDYAPGSLRLLQEFVNTLDEDVDSVSDPQALQGWLVDQRLVTPQVTVTLDEHERAVAIREGLRSLLAAHDGDRVEAADLERLNRLAASIPLRLQFSLEGGLEIDAAGEGVDQALGRILAAAVSGVTEGTWERLKICRADTCRWAFYDASKNRSGTWCSMRVCGNRAKVRAYQERRRMRGSER
jgi:predicted RNA-binding Zn ribbon-like protein